MQGLWQNIFYEPLYNVLVFFVSFLPGHSMALSIVLLTILVKLVLFPLAQKSIRSQFEMKVIEPELKKIKESDLSKEEQAKKTFELYKEKNINPFSGCLPLLIQFPIIIALYSVFIKGIGNPDAVIYSFINLPDNINNTLFGFQDLTQRSIFLALLAGVSQFLQASVVQKFNPKKDDTKNTEPKNFQESLSTSMNFQMRYIFPVFVTIIAFSINSAVSLYWVISNVFTVVQEYVIRKKLENKYKQS